MQTKSPFSFYMDREPDSPTGPPNGRRQAKRRYVHPQRFASTGLREHFPNANYSFL